MSTKTKTSSKKTDKRKSRKLKKKVQELTTNESAEKLPLEDFPVELENILYERIRQFVEWTPQAEIDVRKCEEIGECLPFSMVLKYKIKNSVAGQFINCFNPENITQKEQEYKYFIAEYTLKKNQFPSCYLRDNDYADNMMDIIKTLVRAKRKGRIFLINFLKALTHLRLHSSKIGFIDKPMLRLSELQVLSLAGNSINVLPFDWLPPKLKFLELSGNILSEIRHSQNAPPLMYLGLSKNIFHDKSDVSGLLCMKNLVYLDLSDNDFCQIDNLLASLSQLEFLTSLSLKGNPCSVTIGYAWEVMKGLPSLSYLDGRSLKELDESKLKEENQKFLNYGKLQVHIYRIMGLARAAKRGRGYYEIELQLPLLDYELKKRLKAQIQEELLDQIEPVFDPYDLPDDIMSETTPEEFGKEEEVGRGAPGRRVSMKRKSAISNASGNGKKHRISGTWKIPFSNFLFNDKEMDIEGISRLKSEKFYWNTIMKPKNPIIEIVVPPENIIDLRDTLRTIITLRIYYMETPSRKKEDKRSAKSSSLVAKIRIPAEVPFWNEDYKGYNWEAANYCLAKPFSGIADIRFAVGGKGMPRNGDVKAAVFPPTTNPTCHIGISLQRFSK